jgi:hypothetical protein
MTTPEAFLRALVRDHSWLEPVLSEHLAHYDEVLTHVLMADITRALVTTHLESSKASHERVMAVLTDLEAAFAASTTIPDSEVGIRGLIALSFLFNLPDPGEPGFDIREMLGPSLAAVRPEDLW